MQGSLPWEIVVRLAHKPKHDLCYPFVQIFCVGKFWSKPHRLGVAAQKKTQNRSILNISICKVHAIL